MASATKAKHKAIARAVESEFAAKCGDVTRRQMTPEEREKWGLPPEP
jgi:hypothetical protein